EITRYADYLEKLRAAEARKTDLPEVFDGFRSRLVLQWDEYDMAQREKILALGSAYYTDQDGHEDTLRYAEYCRARSLTPEEIHRANVKSAEMLVRNLLERVGKKVGSVESFDNLVITEGNFCEGCAINGFIQGERGKVRVESIRAGGYKVQRLHVRVLCKEVA
ncbi:MAG: hypothetical protein K6G15_03315, partial [Desulfovibrio sp.]|nr:hypothetical protein [Desulfovibrio sp.]